MIIAKNIRSWNLTWESGQEADVLIKSSRNLTTGGTRLAKSMSEFTTRKRLPCQAKPCSAVWSKITILLRRKFDSMYLRLKYSETIR
jgi:hypothetical protein